MNEDEFLETLCVENGLIRHAAYHSQRIVRTAAAFRFTPPAWPAFESAALSGTAQGLYRVSITYRTLIGSCKKVRYALREVKRLRLTPIEHNIYPWKFADRVPLDRYKAELQPDEEPLFVLDGAITDTSYTHVAFEKGGRLYVPSRCLLHGTMRRWLIDTQACEVCDIGPAELGNYRWVHLINAMMLPGQLVLPTSAITY